MFLYITLGTNDLARARRFYQATMPTLGFELGYEDDHEIGYRSQGGAELLLRQPALRWQAGDSRERFDARLRSR